MKADDCTCGINQPHISRYQAGVVHLGPILEIALSRVSRADKARVAAEFLAVLSAADRELHDFNRLHTERNDLRLVVKDQRRHIENLEAQLKPSLLQPVEDLPQEALAL